jgi:hypothetical protein
MKKVILAILILASIMYAEYRFIMLNLCPYKGDNGTVYVEFMGNVDEYYADPVSELYN